MTDIIRSVFEIEEIFSCEECYYYSMNDSFCTLRYCPISEPHEALGGLGRSRVPAAMLYNDHHFLLGLGNVNRTNLYIWKRTKLSELFREIDRST